MRPSIYTLMCTREKQQAIRDTVDEIIEVLSDYQDTNPIANDAASKEETVAEAISTRPEPTGSVLCVPSRSLLDEAASAMLAQILEKRAIKAVVQPIETSRTTKNILVEVPDAQLVLKFGEAPELDIVLPLRDTPFTLSAETALLSLSS